MLPDETLEAGDIVFAGPHSRVHWTIDTIWSRTEPTGVRLISGMTERIRYDSLANLILFRKANA